MSASQTPKAKKPREKAPPADLLSSDDYRAVLAYWLDQHRVSYRGLCQRTGIPNPGRVSNILTGRDRVTEALVPVLCKVMGLDETRRRILHNLVMCEEIQRALEISQAELSKLEADNARSSTIVSRSRVAALRALVLHYERTLDALRRDTSTLRLLATAKPAHIHGYRILSSWAPPAVCEAARCAWFSPDPQRLSAAFGGAMSPEEAEAALRTLEAVGMLNISPAGAQVVADVPVVTEPRVQSSAVRSYYEGISARSAGVLTALLDDPKGWLGESSRVGALTIALPAQAIPDANAAFVEFHKRIHEVLERHHHVPPDEVYQLFLHLFPLTRPRDRGQTEPIRPHA